jgi:hypothetical protein
VKDAVDIFGDLFANEPERRHFAEYLTGLMIAEKKTVSGINRAFVVTTDPSCLNRWLNAVAWDVTALNDRRLEWLQHDPKTRYSLRGVIALDNTLVDHTPTVSPLIIPLLYCHINGFQRASRMEKPWPGGENRMDGWAAHPVAW